MNKQIINKSINTILNDLEIIKNSLIGLRLIDSQMYLSNYEKTSIDTALRLEKVTCNTRKLVYSTTNCTLDNYLKDASKELNIKISNNNNLYEIEFPALIPKKNKVHSSDFIVSPLVYLLDNFMMENEINLDKNIVICFEQIYDKNQPTRLIRDYDNIDLKRILDIISIYFLKDDSGYYIDTYNTTSFGENDLTKISIMDRKTFKKWVEKSDFHHDL